MTPTIYAYVPELRKTAEEGSSTSKLLQVALGGGLGTGAGLLAGRLAGKGIEKLHGGPVPASVLTPVGGALGGALGLAYSLHKLREMKELQGDDQSKQNHPPGVVSTE